MKKYLVMVAVALMAATSVNAQNDSKWTFNTRAWTTNYFTSAIYSVISESINRLAFRGNESDSLWGERLIPTCDLVFPVGMGKRGFEGEGICGPIYGPYHRAFGNPLKHIGDYGIGLDVSYKPSIVGVYAGAFFKSQEVVYKHTNQNIRGFYFQPRAGLVMGGKQGIFEAGVFYDVLTGCGGTVPNTEKDMLKGGLGLDFGVSHVDKHGRTVLQFSMPLHNFFNTDYAGLDGVKRKVGYIMLTRRVSL